MISIYEDSITQDIRDKADEILRDVYGSSLKEVRKNIRDYVTDRDYFEAINLAYEEVYEGGTSRAVEKFIDQVLDEIIPNIINKDADPEYEFDDYLYDRLREPDIKDMVDDENDFYSYLIDMQMADWEQDRRDRDQEYYDSRF